ncbi:MULTISPECIES: DUF2637 domain-containing protein [Streptomyces]|uniref:DUF2637 domain-containing protein n=1 Tax=Streptomyces TaxID=1883 RepID=UPI00345C4ED7
MKNVIVEKALLDKIKSRLVWWASLALIGGAAAGITGWSLYVIARHYGVPQLLAIGTAAVFDGVAMACLHLAGQAVRERRSALGPHLATLGMAAASIYLNRLHAELIHGGRGAFLLFAMPTVALLLLAGLSWSAHRARMRAQDGDVPATLPKLGFWGWLLATEKAWERTKEQVEAHVTGTDQTTPAQVEKKPRDAAEALREHFAGMNPVAAIQMAHSATPHLTPAELAAELKRYGLDVSAVQVALVLRQQQPHTIIDRPDTRRTSPDTWTPSAPRDPLDCADFLSGVPDTAARAADQLAELVTDKQKAVDIIVARLKLEDTKRQRDSVRRAFDRAVSKRLAQQAPADGEQLALDDDGSSGEGFYP